MASSKWILKPKATGRVELCCLDLGALHHFPTFFLLDSGLDPHRFRDAFAATLEDYPTFAGKLARDDGRFFIDLDGDGVQFEYVESDQPCPEHGPDVSRVSTPALYPELKRVADPAHSPLYAVRLTRFSDGMFAFAAYESHAVRDASALMYFLEDLGRNYRGQQVSAPEIRRSALLANCAVDADQPSALAGLVTVPKGSVKHINSYVEQKVVNVGLNSDERTRLAELTSSFGTRASLNTVLHALMFRSYALGKGRAESTVRANLALDLRYVKGLRLPSKYFGNAILHRSIEFTVREATESSWEELCQRFSDLAISDPDFIRNDVGFLQGCYEERRYDQFGLLSELLPVLSNGGIFLNNVSQLRPSALTIGELAVWHESSTSMAIRIPMAKAGAMNKDGGIKVQLLLPADLSSRYQIHWRQCVDELLQRG